MTNARATGSRARAASSTPNGALPPVNPNGHEGDHVGTSAALPQTDPVLNGKAAPAPAGAAAKKATTPVLMSPVTRQPARKAPTQKAAAQKAAAKNAPRKKVPPRKAPAKAITKVTETTAPAQTATPPPATRPAESAPVARKPTTTPDIWDQRVAGALSFIRRRLTGSYDVDEFGFDRDLTESFFYPTLRVLYQRYFRVETSGVEHLPRDGAGLLVANHSGTIPLDALMLTIAVHDETPLRRHLRLLGADLLFRIPILSELARKTGSTLACNPDAERLMRNGNYVGVFPEGFKGIGKPYRDRYKLQRFGRGGFVAAALRTGTPIVPVSIVGAEEIYPIIANIKPLAKAMGLPYLPVTPLFPWFGPLGILPLPSKWFIRFGEPIETASLSDDPDDPIVVFNLADHVRETIQQSLHTLLERRPDPFG